MGAFTRYLLPIEQYPNARPWERENGDMMHGHLSINDTGDLTPSLTTVPPVDTSTYVQGCGQDFQGFYYPSISYWLYGELPLTAYNITVKYQAYLGCGLAGPPTREVRWLACDLNTLYWESPVFTISNNISNYTLYEYDFGETEPFSQVLWSATMLNMCYFGLEAYQDTFYYTFCPANWLLVSYDDTNAPSGQRGSGLLI